MIGKTTSSPPPYDVAVVLGAAIDVSGRASPALLRRVAHGVALFHQGRVGHLLMSGGGMSPVITEAAAMRAAALAAGVPDAAVVIEPSSRNTLENARFSKRILDERGWRRILLVSDAAHLRRALYAFRRFGVPAEGSPAPFAGRRRLAAELREGAAFLFYLWRVERALRRG